MRCCQKNVVFRQRTSIVCKMYPHSLSEDKTSSAGPAHSFETSSNAMLIWKGLLSSSVAFTFVFIQIQKAPNIAALTNTMLIHRNCLRFQYHLDFSPDMSLLWYVVKSLLSLLTKTRFSNYMWWGRLILWHHSCAIGKTFGAILKLERKGFQGAKIFPSLYFSKGLKFFWGIRKKAILSDLFPEWPMHNLRNFLLSTTLTSLVIAVNPANRKNDDVHRGV